MAPRCPCPADGVVQFWRAGMVGAGHEGGSLSWCGHARNRASSSPDERADYPVAGGSTCAGGALVVRTSWWPVRRGGFPSPDPLLLEHGQDLEVAESVAEHGEGAELSALSWRPGRPSGVLYGGCAALDCRIGLRWQGLDGRGEQVAAGQGGGMYPPAPPLILSPPCTGMCASASTDLTLVPPAHG
jgi:hypothetical protein